MQILSHVLSILSLLSLLAASVTKGERMRRILFLIFLGNVLLAASYFAGGEGINAAASCCLGAVQSIVNYTFTSRGKRVPAWLLALYMVAFVILNLWVSGGISLPVVLVLIGCFTFIMCIAQSSGLWYRIWSISNALVYLVYDLVTASYGAVITHVVLLLFAVGALLFLDLKLQRRAKRSRKTLPRRCLCKSWLTFSIFSVFFR